MELHGTLRPVESDFVANCGTYKGFQGGTLFQLVALESFYKGLSGISSVLRGYFGLLCGI